MDFRCIALHSAHRLWIRIHTRANAGSTIANLQFFRDASHHPIAKRNSQAADSFPNHACANQNGDLYPNSQWNCLYCVEELAGDSRIHRPKSATGL